MTTSMINRNQAATILTSTAPSMKRFAVSLFVSFNLLTILFMHRPAWLCDATNRFLARHLSPYGFYRAHYAGWIVHQYAHVVGLDNQWKMFGRQSRMNWRFVVQAQYGWPNDPKIILLPLPHQVDRTLFEQEVIDFKESKFHLNMYSNPVAREAYSRYLARQFPTHEGRPIDMIIWEIEFDNIVEPDKARRTGSHLEGVSRRTLLEVYACSADAQSPGQ